MATRKKTAKKTTKKRAHGPKDTIPRLDPYFEKREASKFKFVDVTIKGTRPMLMHKFSDAAAEAVTTGKTRKNNKKNQTPREQAFEVAYFNPAKELVFPSAAVLKLLTEMGSYHKQKSSRKSLKYIVPAAVLMMDEWINLHDETGDPLINFEVDSRPVVIRATKGRIMRHRPRLDRWMASFQLRINENVLDAEQIYMLLADGGEQNGLGDYRPEKTGPFGMFQIWRWEERAEELPEAAE